MPVASLVVRIAADIADFEKNIANVERILQRTGNNLETIGTQLTKGLTLPIIAAAGVAAKAAIDFESSFAGVRKTVDATDEQFKELEGQFRNLAKTMPLSVDAINKVAESAGQLGVKREDLAAFTETMIKMGTATNLTADEAAVGMQRFANAIGEPRINMEQLGSSIVKLGQQGASTEKDILELGLRMAGTGAQIGLTAGEIFGMANALSSVGVQAEKGGTAISTLFKEISKAVSFGGSALKEFAEVAFGDMKGASDQFAKLFKEDAAGAITKFVEGLGAIKAAGGDLLPILEQLGITEKRYSDTVLLAANSSDKFAESVKLGNKSFAEGKALQDEYNERLKTTASQLTLLKNNLMDAAITLGQAMLPAINRVVSGSKPLIDGLAGMASGFKALPGPIRDVSLAFLAVLAAAGPVVFIASQVVKAWASLLAILRFVPLALGAVSTALIAVAGVMGATTTGLTGVTGALVLLRGAALAILSPLAAIPILLVGIVSAAPRAAEGLHNMNVAVTTGRFWEFVTTKHAPGIWEPEFWGISRSAKAAANSIEDIAKAQEAAKWDQHIGKIRDLRDTLSGENLAKQVRDLASAFVALDPATQRAADTIKRTGTEALRLRDAGATLSPELEKLANTAMRAVASESNKAAAEFKKVATEFQTLTDSFRGTELIKAMQDTVKAVQASGVAITSMSTEMQQKITETIGAGIDQLRRLGKEAPEAAAAMKNAADAALSAWRNVPTLIGFSVNEIERFIEASKRMLEPLSKIQIPEINLGIRAFMDEMDAQTLARRPIALTEIDMAGVEVGIRQFMDDMDRQITERSRSWGSKIATGIKESFKQAAAQIITVIGDALTSGASEHKWKEVGTAIGSLIGGAIGFVFTSGSPIGAAIGAQIGGAVGGWIGGMFDATEFEKRFRANAAEFTRIMDTLGFELQTRGQARLTGPTLDTGGMTKFDKTGILAEFHGVGIDLAHALMSGSAEFLQNTLDEGREKIAEFRGELQRLTEQGGLASVALLGFRDATRETADTLAFIKSEAIAAADGIKIFLDNATIATAEGAAAMGEIVGAAFAELRAQGLTSAQALKELEPTIAALRIQLQKTGLDGGAAFAHIAALASIAADEVAGPLLTAASGLTRTLEGANNAGFLTQSMFQGIAGEIINVRQRLIDQGHSSEHVNALMQHDLQTIWQLQKDHKFAVDDATQAILDEAEAAGTVGDKYRSAFDRAALAMERVALALEAIILKAGPQGLGKVLDDATKPREVSIRVKFDVDDLYLPSGEMHVPALAHGGIVRRPTLALVGEAGPEAVVPLNQLGSVSPQGTSTVIFEVAGQQIARATVPYLPGEIRRYVPA